MTAKKKATYNPNPIDADGDGIVQEGTEFERPVGTDLVIEDVETDEIMHTLSEALEDTVETTTPSEGVNVYVARDGDSYASVASQFLPEGMKKHEYATQLWRENGGRALKAGVEVRL